MVTPPPSTPPHRALLSAAAVFLLLCGICLLRALPSFDRGTYATEGGEWLSRLWDLGFFNMVFGARGDYGVLANIVVIQTANSLTSLLGGHPLSPSGPAIQHATAAIYAAAIFFGIFLCLRNHHGNARALAVTLLMLLVPDLDGENRIFGEANNVGFFSGLATAFLIYDLWLQPSLSKSRLSISGALLVFHLLTSPLAGMVAAAGCALLTLRALLSWRSSKGPFPLRSLGALAIIALAAWSILHASPGIPDEGASESSHIAAASPEQLRNHFTELVFCRQLFYPLTMSVYRLCSDRSMLAAAAVTLLLTAAWAFAEHKRGTPWRSIAAPLLLIAIAFSMAATTVIGRGWLSRMDAPYSKIWPIRYFLIQAMLATGTGAILLLRSSDLVPKSKSFIHAALLLLAANFAREQSAAISSAIRHGNPDVAARRWAAQLDRSAALHSFANHNRFPGGPNATLRTEMYIDYHFLRVPGHLLQSYLQRPGTGTTGSCPATLTPSASILTDPSRRPLSLSPRHLRIIPRPSGTLVTFDLLMEDSAHFSDSRRKLWFSSLPGLSKCAAWAASTDVPFDLTPDGRRRRQLERWLFKAALWFDQPLSPESAAAALSGLKAGLGPSPNLCLATADLSATTANPSFSAFPDERETFFLDSPQLPAFSWLWNPADLKSTTLSISKDGLRLPDDSTNPAPSLSFSLPAPSLDAASISGLRIEVSRHRYKPARITCILHGNSGPLRSIPIINPEGDAVFETAFLPPPASSGPIHHIELILDNPDPSHSLRIDSLTLYSPAPPDHP
jgi:hypothetical protein